ncbi:hypothetical protein ACIPJG_31965 [Streptomyces halstedii]|uniref:hypothetical protein n=1 Tax=Streptomyces halstedii TaxID=1944 RepID=UPI003803C2DD
MLAWILSLILPFFVMGGEPFALDAVISPAATSQVPEEQEWELYRGEAYEEYADEFTSLFNSYETKWSKNSRLMIRQNSTGPYKFVKKG